MITSLGRWGTGLEWAVLQHKNIFAHQFNNLMQYDLSLPGQWRLGSWQYMDSYSGILPCVDDLAAVEANLRPPFIAIQNVAS